jgi:hypothetical protein
MTSPAPHPITTSIAELNARVARGETSREAVVTHALEATAHDSAAHVFTRLYADSALASVRIPPHLDSDSSGNWTAIPRLTGQLNRVASGVLIVLDPVDGWKGLKVGFGCGCRVMHRRPTARL